MNEPIKAGPFLGINNRLPSDKLIVPKEGAFVRDAINVDLTEAGTFQRRPGHTLAKTTTKASSLWSDGGTHGYYADNGNVMRFDGVSAVVVGSAAVGAFVSFTKTPRGIVWTDGATLQLIVGNTSRPLATPTPNPAPTVVAATGGSMAAGSYVLAFANVLNGERSAVTNFVEVDVPEGGAITVSTPVRAYATQVFVTAVNGITLFLEGEIAAASTSIRLSSVRSEGTPISSEYEAAVPAGETVRHYRGRLLVVQGSFLYYSHPYNYGLCHPNKNFISLGADITLCEPTQTGVFLATADETWFLDGLDVSDAKLNPVAPYGAIPNTAVSEPNTLNLWWFTPRGLVRTTDANTLEMRQDAQISFGASAAGAALLREDNGLTQVIAALSETARSTAASATSYMDAEVVN